MGCLISKKDDVIKPFISNEPLNVINVPKVQPSNSIEVIDVPAKNTTVKQVDDASFEVQHPNEVESDEVQHPNEVESEKSYVHYTHYERELLKQNVSDIKSLEYDAKDNYILQPYEGKEEDCYERIKVKSGGE